jgi:predicted dehydrogenase
MKAAMTDGRRLRIGFVGVQPGRSWAAVAHIPALRALEHEFEIAAVANTTLASAEAAARDCGIPRAFASVDEMVASDAVDMVAVTVKVPHHFDIVSKAIAAGKHVLCEWPLGNGLAEAEALAKQARERGVLGVIGNQAVVAPEIARVRQIIAEGRIGGVRSTSITAYGGGVASDEIAQVYAYMLDRRNGANMLTIPVGHALAALRSVLGDFATVAAILATRQTSVRVAETGETMTRDAPDEVLLQGRLDSGALLSLHYRPGPSRANGFVWEISGTEGAITVTGEMGNLQMTGLAVTLLRDGDTPERIEPLMPAGLTLPEHPIPRNVGCLYAMIAADLQHGTRTAPDFDDAVRTHRVIAAMERASDEGRQVPVGQAGSTV